MSPLCQAVAHYKSREAKSAEEEELVENCFDSLCSALMPPENKERFVKAEGVELMIIICKQKRVAYSSAVKALDFALTRCPAACERFVDVLGLKTLFAAFMGKAPLKRKDAAEAAQVQEEVEERVVSVVASLFGKWCSPPRPPSLPLFDTWWGQQGGWLGGREGSAWCPSSPKTSLRKRIGSWSCT